MALEIERKFLVLDDSYKREAFSSYHIMQGYICRAQGKTVRVRIRDEQGFITIFEQEIPLADAEQLMKLCEAGVIDKTRWLVKSGNHTFEVDEFHGDNQGLVVAEVELAYQTESFEKPHFIGEEVTGDRRYYNAQLCQHPYSSWTL